MFCTEFSLRNENWDSEKKKDLIQYVRFSSTKPVEFYNDLFSDWSERTRSVGFSKYFARRSEYFLDICFLILPTLIVVLILVPTLGFLYSQECMFDYSTTALSIDVVGHQWY